MKIFKYPLALCAAFGLLAMGVTPTQAVSLSPIDDISAIIGNPANNFGPPPTARFTEPGPITMTSGTTTPLFRGPGGSADALLFVLSSYSDPTGGSMQIGGSSAAFGSSFSGVFLPPPNTIPGIGNGQVNGVRLTDSFHAAILGTGFDFSGATDTFLADVMVNLGVGVGPARLDIFALQEGVNGGPYKVINNTPNSGAVGNSVPEPNSILASLLALGMGLALIRRRIT